MDFSITLENDEKISNYENIDMDYYDNVLKYNPYINLDSWKAKPLIVNLNLIKFQTNFTYKDMIEFQDEYEKRSDIYTNDTINEMNSEVKEYKSL